VPSFSPELALSFPGLRDLCVFLLHGFVEIPIAPFLVSPVTSPVVTYTANLHLHLPLPWSPPEVSAMDSAAKPGSSNIQRTRLIISWLLFIVFVALLGFGVVVYAGSSTHLSGLIMAIIGIIGIGALASSLKVARARAMANTGGVYGGNRGVYAGRMNTHHTWFHQHQMWEQQQRDHEYQQ
jgi:hypothetical protein